MTVVLEATLEASSPNLLASTTCIIILNANRSNLVLSFDVWSNHFRTSWIVVRVVVVRGQ
jgi:hypothetical protein